MTSRGQDILEVYIRVGTMTSVTLHIMIDQVTLQAFNHTVEDEHQNNDENKWILTYDRQAISYSY